MQKGVRGSVRSWAGAGVWLVAAVLAVAAAALGQNPGTPPPSGFPVGPRAQVLTFTADSTSIQPGQSVTLTWAAVNADRITIDPGIGIVTTRGSQTVTPTRTTTYTISAIGRGGADKKSLTVTVAGTTAAPETQQPSEESQPIPKMADGKPDLSGVYIGGFAIRPQGPVTLKPGAEKYKVGEDYAGDLGEHCLPPGVPGATQQPYPMQIVETPNQVVILYEAYHLFRVIPTDGRPHPKDLDPTWMGNSVGHWEGDTLVVDVTGFNDKTAVDIYRHTTAYHVVERYTRTSYDQIHYEATISDPNVFAAPFKDAGILRLHPEWQIQEYICEENNHDYKELFEKYKQ
jgi:plastocyanin